MAILVEQIKDLREKTGASVSDVKKALEEARGDYDTALKNIERRLGSFAGKRSGRETQSGIVDAYIHSNGRIGSLVELLCETDFVARNPKFKELAHDVAMHVAAMSPLYLSLDAVPEEVRQIEKKRFLEEAQALNKPEKIVLEIVDGKVKSYFGALSLLEQPFIKDHDKTMGMIVNEAVGRFGENVKVGRFIRFEI